MTSPARPRIRMESYRIRVHDPRICNVPAPDKFADERRGSRHERGYGTEWDRLRARILKRDSYVCQCEDCQAQGLVKPATHVDHRIPKAHGGSDDESNLRAMNADCHKAKTAREGRGGAW